jgi:hypothetical protein
MGDEKPNPSLLHISSDWFYLGCSIIYWLLIDFKKRRIIIWEPFLFFFGTRLFFSLFWRNRIIALLGNILSRWRSLLSVAN